MKHEQRTEDSRFRARLQRSKEVKRVQSRFVPLPVMNAPSGPIRRAATAATSSGVGTPDRT
jgi:hypothetical protein